MSKEHLKIAVDLGGTKIDMGLIDNSPQILQRHRMPTDVEQGATAAVERIATHARKMMEGLPSTQEVSALAICTPGPVDHINGRILSAHNLGWGVVHLRAMLEKQLSIPVVVEHDAKAAALGEFHWGRGQECDNMIYIVIGTGMGGAIIVNGQLYRGERNGAGEVGHITLDYQGSKGNSGIPGNAEYFVAGPGIEDYYRTLCQQQGRVLQAGEGDGKQIGQLASQGDPIALQVIRRAGRSLGITIAALAMILDIRLYVVGSSVAKLGDILLEPARQAIPEYTFAAIAEGIEIELATIIDKAALLGCYYLVKDT